MGLLLYTYLAGLLAVTLQVGNVDNQFYITSLDALSVSQTQPSRLPEIILDGVRLATGATVVVAQSLSFTGWIPAGKITVPMLLQILVGSRLPTDQFTLTYLRGNALKSLLEAYMARSVCSFLPDTGLFPQIAGAIFSYDVMTCEVTEIKICRRWVLSDPSCQEWTDLKSQELIFLALEVSMYANPVIAGIFEGGVAQNVSINMITGVLRYFRQYNGTAVAERTSQDIISAIHTSNQAGANIYLLPIFFGVLILVNIMICCIRPRNPDQKTAHLRRFESGMRKDWNPSQPHVLNQEMARKDMLDYMRLKNSEVEERLKM